MATMSIWMKKRQPQQYPMTGHSLIDEFRSRSSASIADWDYGTTTDLESDRGDFDFCGRPAGFDYMLVGCHLHRSIVGDSSRTALLELVMSELRSTLPTMVNGYKPDGRNAHTFVDEESGEYTFCLVHPEPVLSLNLFKVSLFVLKMDEGSQNLINIFKTLIENWNALGEKHAI